MRVYRSLPRHKLLVVAQRLNLFFGDDLTDDDVIAMIVGKVT